MHQQRHGADVAFSACSADTEDYFAFLPSDESMSDVEDVPEPSVAAKYSDPVDELSSVFASSSSIGSSRVLTPIGSLNGSKSTHKQGKRQIKTPSPGVFGLGGGEEMRVSPRALEQHNARRTQLQEALDAASGGTSGKDNGEAPFRFIAQHKRVVRFADEMEVDACGASPVPVVERVQGHAPEKKSLGRRRPAAKREDDSSDSDEEDETVEPDPLYDEQLDAKDEQWVQTNLRGRAKPETDATLCCPCCFVTVCIACERHATYTNQYRATAAINCRVKRDEILTYTSSEGSRAAASQPFHTRQNLATGNKTMTTGQQIAQLLQEDEFYPVSCSDCGTMVGVFDRHQQYHFFNALPSNC